MRCCRCLPSSSPQRAPTIREESWNLSSRAAARSSWMSRLLTRVFPTRAANGRHSAAPNTKRTRNVARRLDARAPDFAAQFSLLISAKRETEEDVAAAVRGIVADVKARGDDALIELTGKFDKVSLTAQT